MSTKNQNKTEKIVKAEVKESANLDALNLNDLIAKAKEITVKEKGENLTRASLYRYSETEIAEIKKDKDHGKKIRNQIRRQTDFFMHKIAGAAKRAELENVKTLSAEFTKFYKERFLRNDFSVNSVRELKSLDENSAAVYTLSMQIVKAHQ